LILYLDTSALVKLYIDEPGREAVVSHVDEASGVATTRIAYAEARAAFARKRRESGLDARTVRRVVAHLDGDWASYSIVDVGDAIVRRAGALAERHALRAYDAVHLASAVDLHRAGADVWFACFDERLRRAARRERLRAPMLAL